MRNKQNSVNFLAIIILQFILYATILFDIPVARQVIGFLYVTFVPGFIIIKLLKLHSLDSLETLLFSLGLSIAFLTLIGLLANEILPIFGFSYPLSVTPIIITFNSIILISVVIAYLRTEDVQSCDYSSNLKFPKSALIFVCLPILSIVGSLWANTYSNNLILLFMLIVISLFFVLAVVSKKFSSTNFYPFALLAIAVSLLLHSSLASNYIIPFGSDVPVEYFVCKLTSSNAYWGSVNPYPGDVVYGRAHSMLSITILPTIYSNLLNIELVWVFKVIFPLLFSFVPLGLYLLFKRLIGDKWAFISVFFFMSYSTFYTEMFGLNRQMVGEIFLVLLLIVIMNKKPGLLGNMVCYAILSFGLVTSHYGISEVFLFFISFVFVYLYLKKQPSQKITASMVVLLLVLMFAWYIFTSNSTVFNSLLESANYISSRLGEFFDLSTRQREVLRGLGLETPPTVWNAIGRTFAYVTQILIVVGFFGIVTRKVKTNFGIEYSAFTYVSFALLIALIIVPGLAETMNMTRFYHILLIFLAPLCVIGARLIVSIVSKRNKEFWVSVFLLVVLIPYFIFQSGFVYEVTGCESWSIPLSKYRMDPIRLYGSGGYIDASSVFGSQWLYTKIGFADSLVYADIASKYNVLTAYGMIPRGSAVELSNTTQIARGGFVYLSTLNVVYEKIFCFNVWNSSEFSFIFENLTAIYVNGGSVIYRDTT